MTTEWRWRVEIIVPAASRAAADAMAEMVAGAQPAATFEVALSASGLAPATHYGCGTYATDEWLASMQQALPGVPGVLYWRMHGETLVASNSSDAIGSAWNWQASVEDAGLKVIVSPP